jgi:hypothetical protein
MDKTLYLENIKGKHTWRSLHINGRIIIKWPLNIECENVKWIHVT